MRASNNDNNNPKASPLLAVYLSHGAHFNSNCTHIHSHKKTHKQESKQKVFNL